MPIVVLSRWSGASRDDMVRIAGKIKPLCEKHGAEYMRLGQSYSGDYAGQYVFSLRYADWETYGKAMQAMSNDAELQAAYAEAH